MARWWAVLLVGSAGCSLVTTQQIPLILLTEVPVPNDARWTDDNEEEVGGDAGGGLLFFNNQADPSEGLFESLETDEVEQAGDGELYYEGTENRTFFSLFVFFFEGVSFDAKIVRLKAKPLPAEVGAKATGAVAEPVPESEPDPVESEAEPVTEPEAEPEAEPATEEPAADAAEEEPKAKKKKKKKKRKKRKKRGRK